MAKLVVIEGTDCSGKETQSKMLVERLNNEGIRAVRLSFPVYESPTGMMIGACYLGKEHMCKELLAPNMNGFFKEGAASVDSICASLFYAADRRYNLPVIEKAMEENDVVVLDRYVYSNMAHQGGKQNKEDRCAMFELLDNLEFNICGLPRPDRVIFLYVPFEFALEFKKGRLEVADQHENNKEHLKNAEETYLQLANYYGFDTINCVVDNQIRTISNINDELYDIIKRDYDNKNVRKKIK